LPIAKKPLFVPIGHGISLGYRRNQGPGTWVHRKADGRGGHWTKAIAVADDLTDADGNTVLDFWQASERARTLAGGNDDNGKLITVAQALDRYEADLEAHGGDTDNAARVRRDLSNALASKTIALLTARDLRHWRNTLTKRGLSPASINRSASAFKAALNLAADTDERIVNQRAWKKGLARIPDATAARNVVLSELEVRAIIDGAYLVSDEFGLLVEVAAVTGARVSQLARLEVGDLQASRDDPRLMIPSSRKGSGQKRILRRPVPIPSDLAARLQRVAHGRAERAPLLTRSHDGGAWRKSNHTRFFWRAAAHAGLDPSVATIYALRHTSITRQLIANVPIRIVAVLHDTSITQIEATYSAHITDFSDAVWRRALLDVSRPAADNVVPLPRKG
jgi:integrase